jgi:putative addiction module component (TIGR02574 family)
VPLTLAQFGLDRLTPDDQLELLGLLWDNLNGVTQPLPEWHVRELERRRAAADADPTAGIPWADFKAGWLGRP